MYGPNDDILTLPPKKESNLDMRNLYWRALHPTPSKKYNTYDLPNTTLLRTMSSSVIPILISFNCSWARTATLERL